MRIMVSALVSIPMLAGIALAASYAFSPAKHPSTRSAHVVPPSEAPATASAPTIVHTDSTDEFGDPAAGSGTSWTSPAPEAQSVKHDPAFPTPPGSDDSDVPVVETVEPTPEDYWTPEPRPSSLLRAWSPGQAATS